MAEQAKQRQWEGLSTPIREGKLTRLRLRKDFLKRSPRYKGATRRVEFPMLGTPLGPTILAKRMLNRLAH